MLLLFSACKTTKYTPDKLPIRQIVFGDGGGFAGIETSYTLLENGQIFKQVGVEGPMQGLKSIKPKEAKALFDKVNSLQLFKLDMDKPGNMYYYLRQVTDHLDSRVTWGGRRLLAAAGPGQCLQRTKGTYQRPPRFRQDRPRIEAHHEKRR